MKSNLPSAIFMTIVMIVLTIGVWIKYSFIEAAVVFCVLGWLSDINIKINK